MTKREIVTNFKNLYNAGRQSDDVRISDRQWSFIVDYHRAQLIRQSVEKGQSLNESLIQDLGEVKVPKHTACGRWYTEKPLPQAVEVYQQNLLTFVGTTFGHAFQKTTAQKAEWEQYAKFTARKPKWYQLVNTLFLITPPSPTLNVINVRGVFERPREAEEFAIKQGKVVRDLDMVDTLNYEYPISATMLEALYAKMRDNELQLSLALPADYNNDGLDHAKS